MKKELGFIGLGKMGSQMVMNLLDKKYNVVVYNRSSEPVKNLTRKGAVSSDSIEDLVSILNSKPKVIWIMVTAGGAVDDMIRKLLPHLKPGDIIIDGGNSYYKKSNKRYLNLKKKGINFIDCGVSGGITGARNGACMMVGGDKTTFRKVENLFKSMCVKDGYAYMGYAGAGHFVKGIHNAVEYGMLGALNEGMEAIKSMEKTYKTDLSEVAKVYNNGSIIEGRLTNWLYTSFKKPNYLSETSCVVPYGETEKEMKEIERNFKMPVLRAARLMRVNSRKGTICGKFISAVRHEFGGHKRGKNKNNS
ncbi:MAG: NADP-dependent phosphogluconate dehydrogenase [Nanoarchaeota archaeon]|nr:NADP-dependent phosphogluconate dehydrogenase [Nanoarchaeota archaeon]